MANEAHLAILRDALDKHDMSIWNQWRENNPNIIPDLTDADLIEADLRLAKLHGVILKDALLLKANLRNVDLFGSDLRGADFDEADLSAATLNKADMSDAILNRANLTYTDLHGTCLIGADISDTNLTDAEMYDVDLTGADLTDSNLTNTRMCRANLTGADLTWAKLEGINFDGAILDNCIIYGTSVWDINLDNAQQKNIVITPYNEPSISVDNLDVAQLVYLLLNNHKLNSVLETITINGVLVLGKFNDETLKITLNAICDNLRDLNYVPIVFDLERLSKHDDIETIKILAGMCKFVVAELSSEQSIQQGLRTIIPAFEMPLIPIIKMGSIYPKFESHLLNSHVLDIVEYQNKDDLINKFNQFVIKCAKQKREEILIRKKQSEITILSIKR